MRTHYFLLSPEKQARVRRFNVIHPTFYVKTRMLVVRSCFNRNDVFRKVHLHETLKGFLETIKEFDEGLSQRIIGMLPSDIHSVYVEEKDVKSKNTS